MSSIFCLLSGRKFSNCWTYQWFEFHHRNLNYYLQWFDFVVCLGPNHRRPSCSRSQVLLRLNLFIVFPVYLLGLYETVRWPSTLFILLSSLKWRIWPENYPFNTWYKCLEFKFGNCFKRNHFSLFEKVFNFGYVSLFNNESFLRPRWSSWMGLGYRCRLLWWLIWQYVKHLTRNITKLFKI